MLSADQFIFVMEPVLLASMWGGAMGALLVDLLYMCIDGLCLFFRKRTMGFPEARE